MKRLMLDHAFRFVDRVVFVIDPGNRRSQRAVEKIGACRADPGEDETGRWIYEITATARRIG